MGSVSKPNRFEKYPKIVLLVILVPLVLILDLGLTGAYHLLKYGTLYKSADRRALREQSTVFHHTLKANRHHATQTWGTISYPLSTNSLGFKDQAIREVPLTTSRYRMLFIGDSFTEGIGFPYEKTFVGLAGVALEAHNIEVLNAAVSSYSPAIYFKKVEFLLNTVGLKVDHVIVFLDISDILDEEEHYRIRDGQVVWIGGQTSRIKEFVYEYTGLMKNIWTLVSRIMNFLSSNAETCRTEEEKRYGINQRQSLWTIKNQVFSEYGPGGLQKARQHMDMLYDLLDHHEIAMTVVVYPWPDQIIHRDLDSRQVRVWQQWANGHSIGFINLFPYFIKTDSNPKTFISQHFIEGDVHWNAKGHELMAQGLLEQLRFKFPVLLGGQEEYFDRARLGSECFSHAKWSSSRKLLDLIVNQMVDN